MRILHVVPSYLPATRYGGPIYSVHALCAALARRGNDVEVFTTNVDGPGISDVPVSKPVDRDGVKVTYFATSLGRRVFRSKTMNAALSDRIASFNVVHIHSVFLWPTSAAAWHARKNNIPYMLAPRGMLVGDLIHAKSSWIKRAWIILFERRNLYFASAIHVTSQVEADEIGALGLPLHKVAMIPNGVDVPTLSDAACEDQSASIEGPIVLSLGRINWKKGLDHLIRAFAYVPGATLVIAGNDEDNYTPFLRALAEQLALTNRIKFIGPVYGDAKWRLLKRADVFVLASQNENFANAVLEAMACGVAVVVTPGVGLASTIVAANAGLVSSKDHHELARSICTLLGDSNLRRRMGDSGKALAQTDFTWDSIAAKTEEYYHDITRS